MYIDVLTVLLHFVVSARAKCAGNYGPSGQIFY
jgi:hypothetical protein